MNTVSIIVPCYNHAVFLEETLHSALNSTYSPIEIIIINDGSTDNTEEIALKFTKKHPNISYIYQSNQGPAAARNNGISQAKGKYILPLDADDLISTHYIEKAVAVLDQRDDVILVYCKAEFLGEKQGEWVLPEFSRRHLACDNMIFLSALFRKSDWERAGGFDNRMTWGWEDWEFWISMLKNGGEVVRLPITGFYYRIRRGSRRKSTNKDAKRRTISLINEKHRDFIFEQLHGPLHYQRSCSIFINRLHNIFSLKKYKNI